MAESITVHTIPVPMGWSPEQAWEAIRRNEAFRIEDVASYAVIEVAGFIERQGEVLDGDFDRLVTWYYELDY